MTSLLFVGFIFVGMLSIVALIYMVNVYNGLIFLRNQVDRAWVNIDVILKQRHDEIPQLVSICEQFAQYERRTLDRVMDARKEFARARTLNDKVLAASEMSVALQGLLAIGEAYPELRSSSQFIHLQSRVSGLEGEIADRRELFNEGVTNYNTRIQQIPDVLIARLLHYQALDLFEVARAEKRTPSVRMKLPAA